MDSEFCEIDFTTATLWENFTSKIEEIFYSWKLYQPEETFTCENADRFSCDYGTWSVKKEKIDFGGKHNYFYPWNSISSCPNFFSFFRKRVQYILLLSTIESAEI